MAEEVTRDTMPGHAMHDDEPSGSHGVDDHDDHGDHGDGSEPLGPIDVVAWTFSGVGVVLGLVVAAALAIAAGVI